jgi:SPP1 gp7 family putative phage head morphogenesis protein
MATANENIRDALIRHQVYIQRLTTQQIRDLIEVLDSGRDPLTTWLYGQVSQLADLRRMSPQERAAMKAFATEYAKKRGISLSKAQRVLERDTRGLIAHEVKYNISLLTKAVPVVLAFKAPNVAAFADRVIKYGTFAGKTYQAMFDELAMGETAKVITAIQTGLAQGEGIEDMVRRVLGTRKAGYSDGILQGTRNGINSIVRTIDNAIANQAKQATMEANRDIIQEEIFVAVLDGRTTLQCASLDGKRFAVGEGPIPPLHWGCRSTRAPIVDPKWLMQEAGERPFVRDTRTRRFREMDFRAKAKRELGEGQWKKMSEAQRRSEITAVRDRWANANVGQAPATLTFSQWFDRQPAEFQREYLGATRFKLYDSGKLALGQFVDNAGHMLTLKQLVAKDRSLLDSLD